MICQASGGPPSCPLCWFLIGGIRAFETAQNDRYPQLKVW